MKIIGDLHIHSRYSRATSLQMNVAEISRFAQIKGLNLVGTGDFTHPKWFRELKDSLTMVGETGLYKSSLNPSMQVSFMVTGEVSTIFELGGKTKKIHHVILASSLEVARQISDRLSRYGDLSVDGRPTLSMSASQLVEEVLETSPSNLVFPAHAWTPWFSIFGANSGFDRFEDCYEDMSSRVYALETGLSSDPPMNWRVSSLDRLTLLSNSDAHSAWPWRLGREANVFELEKLSYDEVADAIKRKDSGRLSFTVETNPAYGKYHWSGHRRCSVSMPPSEAIHFNNICPKCRRRLTKGVEQRVEELADRPAGFRPKCAAGYMDLLPLPEVIAAAVGAEQPSSTRVWEIYNGLVGRFGSEFNVLLDASRDEIAASSDQAIADAVIRVRDGRVKVTPGYDGVYGKIDLLAEEPSPPSVEAKTKMRLEDFM